MSWGKSFGFLWIVFYLVSFSQIGYASGKSKLSVYDGNLEGFLEYAPAPSGIGPLTYSGAHKRVSVIVSRVGWNGQINITNPKSGEEVFEPIRMYSQFDPTWKHLWKVRMEVDGILKKFELRRVKDCFVGSSIENKDPTDSQGKQLQEGPYTAEVCMRQYRDFSLKIDTANQEPVLRLHASPSSLPSLPSQYPIRLPIRLKDAIQIALETNPVAELEFLKKREAKKQLDLAWLKLLPRANVPALAGFGFATPAWPQSYVATIGTLAPFLSINSWTSVIDARKNCKITEIGFRVFQANLVNQVEQAVYLYRKGVALNTDYDSLLQVLNDAEKKLNHLHQEFRISSQDADALRNALATSISLVVDASSLNSMPNDLFTILQTLGMHDTEQVRNIKIGHEAISIETMVPLDHEVIAQAAAQVSIQHLERLQAQETTQLARMQKIERPFKLLDLVGDLVDGFGMNLYGELKLDDIHIEMSRKIERMIADQLFNTVLNAVENYNDSVLGYKNAIEERERVQKELQAVLGPLGPGRAAALTLLSSETVSNLKSSLIPIVSLYLKFINQSRGYHSLFRISRASIDRALLQNYYSIFRKKEMIYDEGDETSANALVPADDEFNDETVLDPMIQTGRSYFIDVTQPSQQKVNSDENRSTQLRPRSFEMAI